jgi:hypothetical protein
VDDFFGEGMQLIDGLSRLRLAFEECGLSLDHLPAAITGVFVFFVDFAFALGKIFLNLWEF